MCRLCEPVGGWTAAGGTLAAWRQCEQTELGSGLRMAERRSLAEPVQHSEVLSECLRAGAA